MGGDPLGPGAAAPHPPLAAGVWVWGRRGVLGPSRSPPSPPAHHGHNTLSFFTFGGGSLHVLRLFGFDPSQFSHCLLFNSVIYKIYHELNYMTKIMITKCFDSGTMFPDTHGRIPLDSHIYASKAIV